MTSNCKEKTISNYVRIEGPHGAYQVNETLRRFMEVNGMSVVIPSNDNAAVFFSQILEMLPELKRSGVHEHGYFVWERGATVLIWGILARVENENESMAVFVNASMNDDHIPRMFMALQDSARSYGIEPGAVFQGETSSEAAVRIKGSTVVPAQLLLGLPWEGE